MRNREGFEGRDGELVLDLVADKYLVKECIEAYGMAETSE